MRLLLLLAALGLAASGGLAASARPPSARSWKSLKFPPMREIRIPQVATSTLPNGMRLYLLEDHELPLVHGFALIRTGSLFDPAGKTGLASLAGTVIRGGGTQALTGDQIDERLENVAASVESGVGQSSASVSFDCLKDNLADVLGLFHDLLTGPEFRQNKIDLAKQQLRSAIMRRNDDAGSLGLHEFSRILYGRDTPYGRRIELETLENITRDDLIAFHRRYYFPKNVMLAVAGDFSAPDLAARLEKLFAGWNVEQPPVPEFPPVTAQPAPRVYLATKPDVTQTFFYLGQIGGTLRDPDFAALEVMSDILGGGFSSRLFSKVRTQLGLAYHVDSEWGASYLHPGVFRIGGSTQSKSTTEALQAILDEVARIRESEVTQDELQTAKDTVLNSFVFNFDKPSKTLNRLVTYEYYGYPKDFIQQYQKAVAAVTRADVLRVARERLKPETFSIVAVGNPPDFGKPLSALMRRIENLDLTIPEPKAAPVKTDAASTARAGELLERARAAMGGGAKLAAVRDYSTSADTVLATPGGKMQAAQTTSVRLPSVFRQEQQLPFGKVTAFYDGKSGWLAAPQGQMPMPEAVIKQVRTELFRSLFPLLLSDRDSTRTATATGANQVRISDVQGNVVTLDFDPGSGLPAKETYAGIAASGPTRIVETFSDWKEVDGIRLPHHILLEQDGKDAGESTIRAWKLNPGLPLEELSKKP